jgi:hypothetical protein
LTAESSPDPWAILDELLGIEVARVAGDDAWLAAFYGRCSTEDNQNPRTSRAWQFGNAQKFVEPLGATIVAEHFDVGQSRSVPWERRADAARLLADLKNPQRGWNAVVVGEGDTLLVRQPVLADCATVGWVSPNGSTCRPGFAQRWIRKSSTTVGTRADGHHTDLRTIDKTVATLVASQNNHAHHERATDHEVAKKRHADAEASIRRFQAAIKAGIDPAALVEAVNQALAQRDAARAELDNAPAPDGLSEAEIRAMVDYLGDVGASLNEADPTKLGNLYEALRLEMVYVAAERAVDVAIRPARRGSARVRGAYQPKTPYVRRGCCCHDRTAPCPAR